MVQLHVKRGDESQFLVRTCGDTSVDALVQQITEIYDGRLRVGRISSGKYPTLIPCGLSSVQE